MCRTKYADIFRELSRPFDKDEVKTRQQAGRSFSYITARVAMNRLDEVLGPENWWDRYTPHENSVLCELTVRLPDGTTLTKCDAGGYAGMSDQGDDDKSGYSDSFKRACVKFGVARYLYRDGVAEFAPAAPVTASPSAKPSGKYDPATDARPIDQFLADAAAKIFVPAMTLYKDLIREAVSAGYAKELPMHGDQVTELVGHLDSTRKAWVRSKVIEIVKQAKAAA